MKIQWKELFSRDRVICRLLAAWTSYIGISLLQNEEYHSLVNGPQLNVLQLLLWCGVFFIAYTALTALLIK